MNDRHPADDLLVAFALGDLDSPAHDEVASHMQECETCGPLVTRLVDALASYRETPADEAPVGVLVHLLEAQSTAARRARRSARLPRWMRHPARAFAVAALLAMVFLGGFWTGRRSAPEEMLLPEASSLALPLPDPPVIAFYPAVATE